MRSSTILAPILFVVSLYVTSARIFTGVIQKSGCFHVLGSYAFYNMEAGSFEGNNFKFEITFPTQYMNQNEPSFYLVIYVDKDENMATSTLQSLTNKISCRQKFLNAGRPYVLQFRVCVCVCVCSIPWHIYSARFAGMATLMFLSILQQA